MFIRTKFGIYAGEARDVEFLSAKALIESGQAEEVFPTGISSVQAPSVVSQRVESAPVRANVTHVTQHFQGKKRR